MTQFIATDIIGSGNAINDTTTPGLTAGDDLFIARGTNVVSTDDSAIESSTIADYAMVIAGTVVGGNSAILFRETDPAAVMDITVSVLASGTVYAASGFGLEIYNDGGTAAVTGNIHVVNAGSIGAQLRAGMFLGAATTVQVNNSGHIWSISNNDFFDNGIRVLGSDFVSVTNTGLIETTARETSTASTLIDDVAAVSVDLPGISASSTFDFVNSGTVSGGSHSFYSSQETINITNLGTMNGHIQTEAANDGFVSLQNSGDIIGNIWTGDSEVDDSVDIMTNSGTITGTVLLRGFDDVFTNSGQVIGNINLGDENDLYRAIGSGNVTGLVEGGNGDDTLIGADANDTLLGGNNDDVLRGGGGNDHLEGGDNNDTLRGDGGEDTLFGDFGEDVLGGRDGNDSLDGGESNDTINGGSGDDTMFGGFGLDSMHGGNGNDSINGEDGDDTIRGGNGDDTIDGESDSDLLFGQQGNDLITGGFGNDTIHGGNGEDTIDGGADNDMLYGQQGNDTITGDAGFDTLYGGGGNDVLDGGGRADLLDGGTGNDTMTGGGSNDTFVFERHGGDDVITDFSSTGDLIDLQAFGLQNFNRLNTLGALSGENGGVLIDFSVIGGSGSVWLEDVGLASLSSADFIF